MNARVPVEQALAGYVRFFEELSPDTVAWIERLCVPDVRFKDPFNDFQDRARLRRLFERMFLRLHQPRFYVRDQALSGQTAYLRWTFTFRLKRRPKPWVIEGMSEVRFDGAGQVVSHIDHWDAAEQFYEKLPGLGWVLKQVRGRMAD